MQLKVSKMISKNIKYLFLPLLLACTEEGALEGGPDIQKPQIIMLGSSPESKEGMICNSVESNVINASTGSDIVLNLQFSDDNNLSQYKVDIHNNFDCHSHGRLISNWQVLKVENIVGKQVQLEEVIAVPEDAFAGDYHLQILCLDELGNEAEPLIYSIKVENSIDNISPVLALSEPAISPITVSKGSDLSFEGTVTDNFSLNNGKIEITYIDPNGTEFFPIQQFFLETQGTEANFNLKFTVPPSAASGQHNFRITAYDTFNNSVEKIIEVVFQ